MISKVLAQTSFRGNTWSAWSKTTPRHDKFVASVLHCNAHVITCTRSKMETVMGEGKKVHKVGMKDVQREGWEYELTVSLNLDRDTHLATPSKDRTNLFEGKQPFLITEETGQAIKQWCEQGLEPADVRLNKCTTIIELANVFQSLTLDEKKTHAALKDELKAKFTTTTEVITNQ